MNSEILLPVAQHEAGHYVVAKLLGFKTESVSLSYDILYDCAYGGAEFSMLQKLDSVEVIEQYLRNRIIVLFSGVLAETLGSLGKTNEVQAIEKLKGNEQGHGSGTDDFTKIKVLLPLLRNICYPDILDEDEAQEILDKLNDALWDQAKLLVEDKCIFIEEFARELVKGAAEEGGKYELSEKAINELPIFQSAEWKNNRFEGR